MTWLVTGHSLGASRANVACARGVQAGNPPAGIIKFGEPNTGWGEFNRLLQQVPENCSPSYRNMDADGHDLVTDVPEYIPPGFPYSSPWPRIDVTESPPPFDGVDLFRYHHAQLYRAALLKLNPIVSIADVTPIDAINLCIGLYGYSGEPPITWDHYDDGHDDGVVWAMKVIKGTKCFVYRGSKTPGDFIKDGVFPWWYDRDIGPVEIGFLLGSHAVWEEMQAIL